MIRFFLFSMGVFWSISGWAVPAVPANVQEQNLERIQTEIRSLEQGIDSEKVNEASLTSDLKKLGKLLKLQALEIQLGKIAQDKVEERVMEMQVRRDSLEQVVEMRKHKVRQLLSALPALEAKSPFQKLGDDNLINLFLYRETANRLLKSERNELVALRNQLQEISDLGDRLVEERDRLLNHVEDLKEKQEVLALNKKQKRELLKKTHTEQTRLLQAYQLAKAAEGELEAMLNKITSEAERAMPEVKPLGKEERARSFAARKGSLPMPVIGKIINSFGRRYDAASSLYTFHKGIDIEASPGADIKAVYDGKVVFLGSLGGYGKLMILDHGNQYYSLIGHLGDMAKKEGDAVAAGEVIGHTALDGTPVYFEIRQRHVAVNPVPWLAMKH